MRSDHVWFLNSEFIVLFYSGYAGYPPPGTAAAYPPPGQQQQAYVAPPPSTYPQDQQYPPAGAGADTTSRGGHGHGGDGFLKGWYNFSLPSSEFSLVSVGSLSCN